MHRLGPVGSAALVLLLLSFQPLISPSSTTLAAGSNPIVTLRPSDSHGDTVSGPGYFTASLHAGHSATLFALVGNRGHSRAIIEVVPVGARSGVGGGISLDLPSRHPRGVGTWVRTPVRRIAPDPGNGEVVPFTIHVPRGTKPGQYIGALTAYVPGTTTRRHGVSVTVQTRVAIGILIDVPGSWHTGFRLERVGLERRPGSVSVVARIRNTGSTLLKGWGHLWIWEKGRHKPVISAPLAIGLSVPQSTFSFLLPLHWRPPVGTYTFSAKLWWRGGHMVRRGHLGNG